MRNEMLWLLLLLLKKYRPGMKRCQQIIFIFLYLDFVYPSLMYAFFLYIVNIMEALCYLCRPYRHDIAFFF